MTRFLGLIVFAAGFLLISPSLRGSAMDGINAVAAYTSDYSPWSYIVMVILVLGGITLTLRTGQTAR
ncbi:MAG TPA: hypothetical protein VLY24_13975 [Bryobacteraceae bacterium]|nr:hypothetical protein [Bryobacteraceae bacterium]